MPFSTTESHRRAMALALAVGSTLLALYGLEALLTFASPAWIDSLGTSLRKGPSVIAETTRLRDRGISAYPFLQPDTYFDSSGARLALTSGTRVAPLSGIASELTVLCNESGNTIAYRSDSLGFRNPPNVWGVRNPDVALIGDSFAHGFCRSENETIASRLEATGLHAINLGITGAGPLVELGVLHEFAASARPRVVLWLFYEGNDLVDLSTERSTIVSRYLDTAFSQHLEARHAEINNAIREYSDSLVGSWKAPSRAAKVRAFVTLRSLRTATGLYRSVKQPAMRDERRDIELFGRVLMSARDQVRSWGGSLVLVYLPERRRFNTSTNVVVGENHNPREVERQILSTASTLDIPVVNAAAAFAREPDPTSLWNSRRYHYNARGYEIVSRAIIAQLFSKANGTSRAAGHVSLENMHPSCPVCAVTATGEKRVVE